MKKPRRETTSKRQDNNTYTIGELSQQADVTPRTIRFYVAEGLLPPPLGAGRAATYTADHLVRLELIKSLKDEFLPLAEIRDLLAGLTVTEIEELLAQKRRPLPSPRPENAREYIRTLLQTDPETADSPVMLRQAVTSHKKARTAPNVSPPALDRVREGLPGAEPASTWGRISLHPDVELNIRHPPTDPRTPARIQQLLKAARRLFKS